MDALVQYESDSASDADDIATCSGQIEKHEPTDSSSDISIRTQSDLDRSTKPRIQYDFFGLEDDSESDDLPEYVAPKARKLDLGAEVPSTGLWKDFTPVVCEASSDVSQKHITRISTTRKRTFENKPEPIAFVSGGLKNENNEEDRERKIYYVHHHVSANMNRASHSRPRQTTLTLASHAGVVNCVRWCRKRDYSHLATSASSDATVKLWNMFSDTEPFVSVVYKHEKAVSSLSWSVCGRQLLSGSYDRTAVLSDVEKRQVVTTFVHPNYVTKVEYNPTNSRLFATISRNVILLWDVRQSTKPYRSLRHTRKEVTSFSDFVYINDSKEMMTSTDSCEHSLCVFDLETGALVSSEQEMYPERYTCPRLVVSRRSHCVLAQTQGDYICELSVRRPYKLNRSKRFQGHRVAGYPVGFDLTCDSRTLVSGSADSQLHLYDWYSGKAMGTISTDLGVCTDVACHPVIGNVVLVGSWNGKLALIK